MLIKDQYAKDAGAWCNLNKPKLSESEADVVIFGIPFDEGVSYRSGASEGPVVLRKNTFSSTPYTERFESIADLKVLDAGDFCCEKQGKAVCGGNGLCRRSRQKRNLFYCGGRRPLRDDPHRSRNRPGPERTVRYHPYRRALRPVRHPRRRPPFPRLRAETGTGAEKYRRNRKSVFYRHPFDRTRRIRIQGEKTTSW